MMVACCCALDGNGFKLQSVVKQRGGGKGVRQRIDHKWNNAITDDALLTLTAVPRKGDGAFLDRLA